MKMRVLFPLLVFVSLVWPVTEYARNADSSSVKPHTVSQTATGPSDASEAKPIVPSSLPGALTSTEINDRIEDAESLLKREESRLSGDTVRLAALDRARSEIHLFSLSKDLFLTRGAEVVVTTSLGHQARIFIARTNGVNTAVVITDLNTSGPLVPLVVQYPIVKEGNLKEMAYYTSAHPSLLTTEVITAGKTYVRSRLDVAAARLRSRGIAITPEIVDIAEHLAIVEHTDHKRFMTEDRSALFNEILSLYALNEGDTYRYSISTAGAGGMIQMIPSTYEMVRRRHPDITLKADFVEGMSDHANAAQVMLLYMQDTWDDLLKSSDIRAALDAGLATQPELVAAGYNSNPARLASYIRRGGSDWRILIPTETQMYLRIYGSLNQSVAMKIKPRRTVQPEAAAAAARKSPLLATLVNLFL